jgi:hypothetical protein
MNISAKKAAMFLLLAALAVYSQAESFYGCSTGFYHIGEEYLNDSYGRELNGFNLGFTCYYFPPGFFLGLFVQTTIGAPYPYVEWNDREQMDARKSSILDLRTIIAPSVKLQIGPKFRIPFSLGPFFGFYNEETTERLHGTSYESRDYTYRALNMGIGGDVALVFNPADRFFLRYGVNVDWTFLRAEQGRMRMNYRTTDRSRFEGTPYSALDVSVYFGLGVRFASNTSP